MGFLKALKRSNKTVNTGAFNLPMNAVRMLNAGRIMKSIFLKR